jgi:hypothetical protein
MLLEAWASVADPGNDTHGFVAGCRELAVTRALSPGG